MIRRRYIIDKKFQWTIVGYTFAISVLTSIGHVTLARLQAFAEMQIQNGLGTQLMLPRLISIGVIAVLYGGVLIVAILFSNRLAGPLFRLRGHMNDVAAKKPASPVHFRKHDYYADLNASYNRLIASLPKDRKREEKNGFSLVEMMAGLAIMMVLMLIATWAYTGVTQQTLLFSQDVNRMQGILMTGRNSAMSKNECAVVTAAATSVTVATYPLGAPCTGALPPADYQTTQNFNVGTTVGQFTTGASLIFKPGGGTTVTFPVSITLSSGGLSNVFTIYPAIGQVRHL
jgi:prepilin-type N-terminal cleavage/methylation domain-containing protein